MGLYKDANNIFKTLNISNEQSINYYVAGSILL